MWRGEPRDLKGIFYYISLPKLKCLVSNRNCQIPDRHHNSLFAACLLAHRLQKRGHPVPKVSAGVSLVVRVVQNFSQKISFEIK